ncbi:MAG: hypothetical protein AAFX94_01340 [Myxococcota bacterium]
MTSVDGNRPILTPAAGPQRAPEPTPRAPAASTVADSFTVEAGNRTESAPVGSEPAAPMPVTPLTLAASAAETEGNVMALQGSVGDHGGNRPADLARVAARLETLGLLAADHRDDPNAITAAITRFQETHGAAVAEIVAANRTELFDDGSRGGTVSPGRISPGDATHQALANAWPRVLNGETMTEAEAYAYLAGAAEAATGNFNESRINIVGVRAFQGGSAHENPRVSQRTNRYDDEIFVLSRTADGQPRVRSFMATTDPGGRQGFDRTPDPRTTLLEAGQRVVYRVGTSPTARFQNRPALWMQAHRGVLRDGELQEEATAERNGRAVTVDSGIAIHSGGTSLAVTAYSTGCQVCQGNWYPAFYGEVAGALRPDDDHRVFYTLLDGRDLPEP